MSLTRVFYDPFTEFDRLFDDAFNARFRPSPTAEGNATTLARQRNGVFPKMDLHDNLETQTVTVTMELPGLKSEDIAIEVHGNRLAVSGETKRAQNHEKGAYAVQERSYGKFSRTIQIPQGIKVEEVNAKTEDGVLTITFPKAALDQQPKRVTIT